MTAAINFGYRKDLFLSDEVFQSWFTIWNNDGTIIRDQKKTDHLSLFFIDHV